MDSSIVSILLPVYNVGTYLPSCLNSIITQTYKQLQIVLIDDGSKDNSLTICQEYATRDKRIKVFHQENQGVATTRNHLLEKVKGDYVLFVDSDDWIEADMVESLLELAKRHDADIVNCQSVFDDALCKKGHSEVTMWSQEEAIYQFLRHTQFFGSLWNKLIKSELLHNLQFQPNISYGEDALFCWHVLQRVKNVVLSNQQLYHHRMNDGSLSHQNWTPEKKGSGTIVWKTITEETAQWWPQYLDIAKARYAIEDMWGLYYASLSHYPYDKHIKERQHNIRKNLRLIRKSKLVSTNKVISCYALAYCYKLGYFLKYTR